MSENMIYCMQKKRGEIRMARTKKPRTICSKPRFRRFFSADSNVKDVVRLSFDEYEVLRLHDLEHLTQEEAAKQMQVSRPTVTEILMIAREKLADVLVNGKQLVLESGGCEVCEIGVCCPKEIGGECKKKHACGATCRQNHCQN